MLNLEGEYDRYNLEEKKSNSYEEEERELMRC